MKTFYKMGIKGLNNLIKRHAPYSFGEITLNKLEGTRVAIDAYGWIHSSYPSAKKIVVNRTDVSNEDPSEESIFKEWVGLLFHFIQNWVQYSITPVFVFDGDAPMEKSDTRKKRRESQQKTKERMLELKERVRSCDPLMVTADMISELRKRMTNTRTIHNDSIEYMKNLLKTIGIPYLQAKYEGEQLCSMLAIEGIACAVYSTDTDNLAYGAPLLITKFSGLEKTSQGYVLKCKCVWIENIFKQLKYDREKFVDLCILSGCDYNVNMPKIAIFNAYKLLNQYNSIDSFPVEKYQHLNCLKHHRCREMFKIVSSESLIVDGFTNIQKNKINALRSSLEEFDLLERHYYLETLVKKTKEPTNYPELPPPKLPIIKHFSNVTLKIMPK